MNLISINDDDDLKEEGEEEDLEINEKSIELKDEMENDDIEKKKKKNEDDKEEEDILKQILNE